MKRVGCIVGAFVWTLSAGTGCAYVFEEPAPAVSEDIYDPSDDDGEKELYGVRGHLDTTLHLMSQKRYVEAKVTLTRAEEAFRALSDTAEGHPDYRDLGASITSMRKRLVEGHLLDEQRREGAVVGRLKDQTNEVEKQIGELIGEWPSYATAERVARMNGLRDRVTHLGLEAAEHSHRAGVADLQKRHAGLARRIEKIALRMQFHHQLGASVQALHRDAQERMATGVQATAPRLARSNYYRCVDEMSQARRNKLFNHAWLFPMDGKEMTAQGVIRACKAHLNRIKKPNSP